MTLETNKLERAKKLAEKHSETSYRNRADVANPAFGFTPASLAALIAEVEESVRLGWHPFPANLQNPDGVVLNTASYLLKGSGHTHLATTLAKMADDLLIPPAPKE